MKRLSEFSLDELIGERVITEEAFRAVRNLQILPNELLKSTGLLSERDPNFLKMEDAICALPWTAVCPLRNAAEAYLVQLNAVEVQLYTRVLEINSYIRHAQLLKERESL